MVGRVFTIRQPRTEWIVQVAGRLLKRSPNMTPLEAVRLAMDAIPESLHTDPEAVAELIGDHAPSVADTLARGAQANDP